MRCFFDLLEFVGVKVMELKQEIKNITRERRKKQETKNEKYETQRNGK
jgi:hypothetical protein